MPNSSDIDVSILIVSYNTREMTAAAIESVIAETTDTRFEIIVVDNASTDGSADMLRAHPARPHLIALDQNIGFAQGNNLAARHARGRYILLLNPDTVVRNHAIDHLVRFAERNPLARIWGGRTLFADGTLNPASCWRRMTVWNLMCRASGLAAIAPHSRLFNSEEIGGWKRDSVRHVDIVSGCFLLTERTLWDSLGGFDPLFFMYGEEADLCLRARAEHHARPLLTPAATIVHYGGASETVRADKMVRLLKAKSSLINRHWSPLMQGVGRRLLAAWPLSRLVATKVLMRLRPNAEFEMAHATWAEIWGRRTSWMSGYNELPAQPREPRHSETVPAPAPARSS